MPRKTIAKIQAKKAPTTTLQKTMPRKKKGNIEAKST